MDGTSIQKSLGVQRSGGGIGAVSDVELFVLAHALKVEVAELYPSGLLKTIREGRVTLYHVRGEKKLTED